MEVDIIFEPGAHGKPLSVSQLSALLSGAGIANVSDGTVDQYGRYSIYITRDMAYSSLSPMLGIEVRDGNITRCVFLCNAARFSKELKQVAHLFDSTNWDTDDQYGVT